MSALRKIPEQEVSIVSYIRDLTEEMEKLAQDQGYEALCFYLRAAAHEAWRLEKIENVRNLTQD